MKKNTSVRGLILISLMSLVPLVTLAAAGTEVTTGINTFGSIINTITQSIVRSLATLFATAAMAAFFYGIVQYIWGVRDGKPDKVAAGNKFMVSGLIALFVMFSVWGIIIYTQKIFGIQGQSTILIPDVRIQGSNTPTPADPLGGGVTKKANGSSCTTNADCTSGFCDTTDDICTAVGGGNKKPNGFTCASGTECESGYCDAVDDTCSAVPAVTGGGDGTTPVGYCPDGSPYYSVSDAKFCQ